MNRKLLFCAWVLLVLALVGSASTYAAQQSGRFKDDGNGGCFFDPNDDGPDQCFPVAPQQAAGRFKDDGNGGCFFDPNDDGPDQCTPAATTNSTSSSASTSSKSRVVGTASKPRG
jgi:hypothetical protein